METGHRVQICGSFVHNRFCNVNSIIEQHASLGDHTGWWDCCYGAHPSQLVIADSSSVSLLDLRVKLCL